MLLTITYVVFVALRFLFAVATHAYPTMVIDEILYYNIARSLANGSGILYLGQPADYTSILYPLILSPIYALFPRGTNYMRLMQLWNILLMNLSLFPVYALAKEVTGKHRTAYAVSLVSLLLPDMIIGGMLMSESILYPLFFTLMYCAYRYTQDRKTQHILLVGLIGGLLYFTKPGQVVPAVVFLLAATIFAIKKRDSKEFLKVLSGIGCLAAVVAALYGFVFFICKHPADVLGLYQNQVDLSTEARIDLLAKGIVLSPYCFILCTGLCFFALLYRMKQFSAENKAYLWFLFSSVVVTILGTAWLINRVEYDNYAIHTRYIAVYIPLILLFSLLPGSEKSVPTAKQSLFQRIKQHPAPWIAALYFWVCSLLFGINAGIREKGVVIFNMGLSLFRNLPSAAVIILSGIAILTTFCFVYRLPFLKEKTTIIICIGFLVLVSLVNNSICYDKYSSVIEPLIQEDKVIASIIGDEKYLNVQMSTGKLYHIYLDVNNPDDTQSVLMNDFATAVAKSKGVYKPFVPSYQRGIIPVNETPDVDLLLIDQDAMKCIQLSSDTEMLNGEIRAYNAIRITKGKPCIDSVLSGTNKGFVEQGQICKVLLLTEDLQQSPVSVFLDVEFSQETEFRVYYSTEKYYSFHLPTGRDEYTINISHPTDTILLSATDAEMQIYEFKVSK